MLDVPIRLVSLGDLPPIEEPEETGTTFEENARLKAHYYSARSGLWTVAEDSGLVIDALGGAPGVKSARFLRADATYPERFAEIYRRLDARAGTSRTARKWRLRVRPHIFLCTVQANARRGDRTGEN